MSGGYYNYVSDFCDPESLIAKIPALARQGGDEWEHVLISDLRTDGYAQAANAIESLTLLAVTAAFTPPGSPARHRFDWHCTPVQQAAHVYEWWKSGDRTRDDVDTAHATLLRHLRDSGGPVAPARFTTGYGYVGDSGTDDDLNLD